MTSTAPPRDRAPSGERRRPRMDPRISQRRTAVLRQQGRRRLWVLVALLVLVTVAALAWFVLHTPIFGARSVTVTGAVHESPSQVVRQAGLAGHPPLLDVDPGAVSARIEQLPWVRSATVRVAWPDGVHIAVTEEVPRFAVAASGGSWASVSDDGRVVAVSPARPPGLLLVTLPVAPRGPGSMLPARDAVGLRVATTLPASFAAQVTSVTVEPAGWVQLALSVPVVVDIGSASELTAKYEDVSSILAGATLHSGDVIDVSVPKAPSITSG